MHMMLTTPRGERTLVSVAQAMAITRDGDLTRIRFLVPCDATAGGNLLFPEDVMARGPFPGFMATNLVTPHHPPEPALVNVAAAVRIEGCEEGVLLHYASEGRVSRLLVDAGLDDVAEALRAGQAT